MFAVKGWSVSADKLKVEIDNGHGAPATTTDAAPAPSKNKNKKRKRPGQNVPVVNITNLSDMWEKVIEKKDPSAPAEKPVPGKEKKASKAKKEGQQKPAPAAEVKEAAIKSEAANLEAKASKEQKKNKKNKKQQAASPTEPEAPAEADEADEWGGFDDDESPETTQMEKEDGGDDDRKAKKQKLDKKAKKDKKTSKQELADTPAAPSAPPPPAAVKLTPLQASMREKLVSARFRHLNETLYARPSAEAFKLFEDSPEMFSEYHEGFRRQVDVWPENPVDGFVADTLARAKVRFPPKNVKHDFANPIASIRLLPLPRDRGSNVCSIADLGCGDAALSAALQPHLRKSRLAVHSFDLQTGGNALITRADIANLPLKAGSADVAIFCLALMGTNWVDFVEEAYRILRWKGELWVAEIKSRFTNPASKKNKVVSHSVGNNRKAPVVNKAAKKAHDEAEAEANDEELAIQVDGAELRNQETDITAFVDALRARGFLLHKELGAGAVDMGNKMFVKMHFVKAAPATKGKCAEVKVVSDRMGAQGPAQKKKFIADEEGGINEAKILKPCVYKLR
ncbi:hypothetical protein OQA88_11934 [Cercophora sp. LCS_1]